MNVPPFPSVIFHMREKEGFENLKIPGELQIILLWIFRRIVRCAITITNYSALVEQAKESFKSHLGRWLRWGEGQNEEENKESLRKNWLKFEEKMRKVELLPTRDCEAGYSPGDGPSSP